MNDSTKKKPDRHVKLVRHPEPGQPGRLIMFEKVGKRNPRIEIDDYLIIELACDYGIGFQLEKTATTRKNANVSETYHVNLDGTLASCDCRGHEAWSKCKQVSALRQLLDNGKMISLLRMQAKQDQEALELIEACRFDGPDLD